VNTKPIEQNIDATIKRMKREGTIGASLACLRQNTPTRGVDIPVPLYRDVFDQLAVELAKKHNFKLLGRE